jgi:hypothetical protein
MYGLNVKYSLRARVEAWFPAKGNISGGRGNFRRWGLTGGSRSKGV